MIIGVCGFVRLLSVLRVMVELICSYWLNGPLFGVACAIAKR